MNKKHLQLAAHFLSEAADEFSNHGCNDIDPQLFSDWSEEEKDQLMKDYHEYNGDPQEYEPGSFHLTDNCLMKYFAAKLMKESPLREKADKLAEALETLWNEVGGDLKYYTALSEYNNWKGGKE